MKTTITAVLICATCYPQPVTIITSGSTNTGGFQIVVEKSGKAEYTSLATPDRQRRSTESD
jgi:hypothetical protein